MVEGWKTHSNKENKDGKRNILIDGRGLETHSKRREHRVGGRTILIDGRRLENTLDKEDKDGKRIILIDGWKTHTKRKKNKVEKHAIFSLWLRVGKHT